MTKILLTLLFKLSLISKSIVTELIIFIDDIIIFFDDAGIYVLNALRSIRFEEVREYLTENLLTIILILILVILIYSSFNIRSNIERN